MDRDTIWIPAKVTQQELAQFLADLKTSVTEIPVVDNADNQLLLGVVTKEELMDILGQLSLTNTDIINEIEREAKEHHLRLSISVVRKTAVDDEERIEIPHDPVINFYETMAMAEVRRVV